VRREPEATRRTVYARGTPLTYVDAVQAPARCRRGRHDHRCLLRQIENWITAAPWAGKDVQVYAYDAGHGPLAEERTRQVRFALQSVVRRAGLASSA